MSLTLALQWEKSRTADILSDTWSTSLHKAVIFLDQATGSILASILPFPPFLSKVARHLKCYDALLIPGITVSYNTSVKRCNSCSRQLDTHWCQDWIFSSCLIHWHKLISRHWQFSYYRKILVQLWSLKLVLKTKKIWFGDIFKTGFFFCQVIQSSVLPHTWKKVYEATTWKRKVKKSEEKSNNIIIISGQLPFKKKMFCHIV